MTRARSPIGAAARSVVFSTLGFAWPVLLMLAATPFVLRGLGPAAYGVWALVGNIVGYFGVVNSLQTAGTKYLAEYIALDDHERIGELLGTSLAFNLLVGALACAAIVTLATPLASGFLRIPRELQGESVVAFRLAGLGFFVSTIGWWAASVLAGLQRFDLLTGTAVAATTFATLATVLAVWLRTGIVGVALANVVALTVAAALSVCVAVWALGGARSRLRYDATMLRRILAYGLYSTLHIVFGIVTTQLDRTVLGVWIGVTAVTLYTIPLGVASRIHQLCAKALEVVFPMASTLDAQALGDQVGRLFLRAQNASVAIVVLISVPLVILARPILALWIDADFAARGALVLQLLVLAYALLGLTVVGGHVLAGLGRPGVSVLFAAALAAANLLGYALFIPRWGVNGAGAASLFGSALTVPFFVLYVNRRVLRIPLRAVARDALLKPAAAGLLPAAFLMAVRAHVTSVPALLAALSLSCALYAVATVPLGVWQAPERALAGRALRRVHDWIARSPVADQ